MEKKRTDLSTAIGLASAIIMVVAAIEYGGDIRAFFDIPSILIVICGTLVVTMACYNFSEMMRAQLLMFKTITYSAENPTAVGVRLLELAEEARKNGVLGLQNTISSGGMNRFLRKGLEMVIDGVEPDAAERILKQEVSAAADRHGRGASIFRKSAEIAPAMGLVGTLIGLIQMLGHLDKPEEIGPSMAVALLTTLYGAMLAYVIFMPLASKLERNSREEALVNSMYIKAVVSIGKQENPRRLEMLLNTLLPPAKRIKYFD